MITDGRNNVLLWDGREEYEFVPAPAEEVSAVGCGDATLAGLVYGRSQGMSLPEAAVIGLAAGAADAEKAGPCAASYEEVLKKINSVTLLKKSELFQVQLTYSLQKKSCPRGVICILKRYWVCVRSFSARSFRRLTCWPVRLKVRPTR